MSSHIRPAGIHNKLTIIEGKRKKEKIFLLTIFFFDITPTSLPEALLAIDSTPAYYASHMSCFEEQKNKKNEKSAHLPPTTPSSCDTTRPTSRTRPTKSNAAIERKRTDLRSPYDDEKTKQKRKEKKKRRRKRALS
jgi:hypothetical protein